MSQTYYERFFTGWLSLLPGLLGIGFVGAFIYQNLVAPLGSNPAPDLIFLGTGLFLIVVGVNFSLLTIVVDRQGLSVSYGLIRHRIPWKQVTGYYRDEAPNIQYGGFGIRVGMVNGRSRLIYNTAGMPRVVIQQRDARMQEFVFSTRQPEKLMDAIQEQLGYH